MLSLVKGLLRATKALLLEQRCRRLLNLVSAVLLLLTVPRGLVLSRRLVLWLFVGKLLIPIWLVWYVRFRRLSHLMDIVHSLISFRVE